MAKTIKFGWRIPDFPVDNTRGHEFTAQIIRALDELHEYFDSAWQADHFVPWARFQDPLRIHWKPGRRLPFWLDATPTCGLAISCLLNRIATRHY
jgi:hypothetical protein